MGLACHGESSERTIMPQLHRADVLQVESSQKPDLGWTLDDNPAQALCSPKSQINHTHGRGAYEKTPNRCGLFAVLLRTPKTQKPGSSWHGVERFGFGEAHAGL